MPDLSLDLRFLRYARLVAAEGSFRKAADRLQVSQSTLTRRVQLLERRLGVALFDRSRNGSQLTLAGQQFIDDTREGEDRLAQAVARLRADIIYPGGVLRIGVMPLMVSGFLAEKLLIFREKFPDIDLRLEEASYEGNVSSLLSRRIDAAFLPGVPEIQGFEVRSIWKERVRVALSGDHALAENANVHWSEIKSANFLVPDGSSGAEISKFLHRRLSDWGMAPRIYVQNVGRETLLNMVSLGFGIALICSAPQFEFPGVRFRPLVGPIDFIEISAVSPEHSGSPILSSWLDICRRVKSGVRGDHSDPPSLEKARNGLG